MDDIQWLGTDNSNFEPLKFKVFHCQDILKYRYMVIVGGSVQRSVYKDFVLMLQENRHLNDNELRKKGERSFLNDKLLSGGSLGEMTNAPTYSEVREYKTDCHHIGFHFMTHAYGDRMEALLNSWENGSKKPDILIMNSCLWDLRSKGVIGTVGEYQQKLTTLFQRLHQVLPDTLRIWSTAAPVTKTAKAGCIPDHLRCHNDTLPVEIMQCNWHAKQLADQYDMGIVDMEYYFQHQLYNMAGDGVHWNGLAHRRMSNIILTYICNISEIELPPAPEASVPLGANYYQMFGQGNHENCNIAPPPPMMNSLQNMSYVPQMKLDLDPCNYDFGLNRLFQGDSFNNVDRYGGPIGKQNRFGEIGSNVNEWSKYDANMGNRGRPRHRDNKWFGNEGNHQFVDNDMRNNTGQNRPDPTYTRSFSNGPCRPVKPFVGFNSNQFHNSQMGGEIESVNPEYITYSNGIPMVNQRRYNTGRFSVDNQIDPTQYSFKTFGKKKHKRSKTVPNVNWSCSKNSSIRQKTGIVTINPKVDGLVQVKDGISKTTDILVEKSKCETKAIENIDNRQDEDIFDKTDAQSVNTLHLQTKQENGKMARDCVTKEKGTIKTDIVVEKVLTKKDKIQVLDLNTSFTKDTILKSTDALECATLNMTQKDIGMSISEAYKRDKSVLQVTNDPNVCHSSDIKDESESGKNVENKDDRTDDVHISPDLNKNAQIKDNIQKCNIKVETSRDIEKSKDVGFNGDTIDNVSYIEPDMNKDPEIKDKKSIHDKIKVDLTKHIEQDNTSSDVIDKDDITKVVMSKHDLTKHTVTACDVTDDAQIKCNITKNAKMDDDTIATCDMAKNDSGNEDRVQRVRCDTGDTRNRGIVEAGARDRNYQNVSTRNTYCSSFNTSRNYDTNQFNYMSNSYNTPLYVSNPYDTPISVSNQWNTPVSVNNLYNTPFSVTNPYNIPFLGSQSQFNSGQFAGNNSIHNDEHKRVRTVHSIHLDKSKHNSRNKGKRVSTPCNKSEETENESDAVSRDKLKGNGSDNIEKNNVTISSTHSDKTKCQDDNISDSVSKQKNGMSDYQITKDNKTEDTSIKSDMEKDLSVNDDIVEAPKCNPDSRVTVEIQAGMKDTSIECDATEISAGNDSKRNVADIEHSEKRTNMECNGQNNPLPNNERSIDRNVVKANKNGTVGNSKSAEKPKVEKDVSYGQEANPVKTEPKESTTNTFSTILKCIQHDVNDSKGIKSKCNSKPSTAKEVDDIIVEKVVKKEDKIKVFNIDTIDEIIETLTRETNGKESTSKCEEDMRKPKLESYKMKYESTKSDIGILLDDIITVEADDFDVSSLDDDLRTSCMEKAESVVHVVDKNYVAKVNSHNTTADKTIIEGPQSSIPVVIGGVVNINISQTTCPNSNIVRKTLPISNLQNPLECVKGTHNNSSTGSVKTKTNMKTKPQAKPALISKPFKLTPITFDNPCKTTAISANENKITNSPDQSENKTKSLCTWSLKPIDNINKVSQNALPDISDKLAHAQVTSSHIFQKENAENSKKISSQKESNSQSTKKTKIPNDSNVQSSKKVVIQKESSDKGNTTTLKDPSMHEEIKPKFVSLKPKPKSVVDKGERTNIYDYNHGVWCLRDISDIEKQINKDTIERDTPSKNDTKSSDRPVTLPDPEIFSTDLRNKLTEKNLDKKDLRQKLNMKHYRKISFNEHESKEIIFSDTDTDIETWGIGNNIQPSKSKIKCETYAKSNEESCEEATLGNVKSRVFFAPATYSHSNIPLSLTPSASTPSIHGQTASLCVPHVPPPPPVHLYQASSYKIVDSPNKIGRNIHLNPKFLRSPQLHTQDARFGRHSLTKIHKDGDCVSIYTNNNKKRRLSYD
ncbi:unnamed protein product [Owenia fusiformis]|uniref:Uncharacterized protein n=1 Tax=Owenia fusiformis TaxID=6347 RepID=A0A8J1XGR9_OWEFU|nr:unnamed protein product [Owenia fusiformis]